MITNSLQSNVNRKENGQKRKTKGNKLTTCVRCSCRKRRWCWRIPGLSPWTSDRVGQSGGHLQNIATNKDLVIYGTNNFLNEFEKNKINKKGSYWLHVTNSFLNSAALTRFLITLVFSSSTCSDFSMMEINAGLWATGAQPVAVLTESSKREKFFWVKSHDICQVKTIQQAVHAHFPRDEKTFL